MAGSLPQIWRKLFENNGQGPNIKSGIIPIDNDTIILNDDNKLETSGIPSGVITMWSGAIADIPTGWALCNGQNGTPNLRDRFVVGAGGGYAVGVMGGSSTSGATTLATSQIPGHTHSLGIFCWSGYNNNMWHPNGDYTAACGYEEGNNGVRNAQSAGGGGSHTHTVTPPYYALAYIMKL